MPGRDFAGALDLADGRLAEAFNVPLEQVAPRRAELVAPGPSPAYTPVCVMDLVPAGRRA